MYDSCVSQCNIELDYSSVNTNKRLNDALSQIAKHGCGGSVALVLQGLLIRDRPNGYGHVGSNQVKMIVTEILKIGRVKYK